MEGFYILTKQFHSKALQLALNIAEQEKWPILYTDPWMVAKVRVAAAVESD